MDIIPIVINVLLIGVAFLLTATLVSFLNKKWKSIGEKKSTSGITQLNPNFHNPPDIVTKEMRAFRSSGVPDNFQYHKSLQYSADEELSASDSFQNNTQPSTRPLRKTLGKTGKFEVLNNDFPEEAKNAANW